ncbi:hypothetical protein [Tardiphaga sp.]|uniref:hypothetical protein n=1 Tax=Tardiphaga sp. TaxID=1926292 RepID=UPI0037D9D60D
MGNIKTLADIAFSDYVTPGVPASGVKWPPKSEIRKIFDAIDQSNDVISFAEYSPKGNDVDYDDDAFDNFMNAVEGSGRRGYIPPGLYRLGELPAVRSGGQVQLFGAGPITSILRPAWTSASTSRGAVTLQTSFCAGSMLGDFGVIAQAGSSGGCAISLLGHASAGAPDRSYLRNMWLTRSPGANHWSGYTLNLDGSARTGFGLRDCDFEGLSVFGGAAGACLAKSLVGSNMGIHCFQAGGVSGRLSLAGVSGTVTQGVNVRAGALAGISLDWVTHSIIDAGVVFGDIERSDNNQGDIVRYGICTGNINLNGGSFPANGDTQVQWLGNGRIQQTFIASLGTNFSAVSLPVPLKARPPQCIITPHSSGGMISPFYDYSGSNGDVVNVAASVACNASITVIGELVTP